MWSPSTAAYLLFVFVLHALATAMAEPFGLDGDMLWPEDAFDEAPESIVRHSS